MKIQKSLCLHVWWLRIRSKYSMVTKFFSAQRYDPRQVPKNLVCCAKPHKKLSRPPQSHTVECVKHNFHTPWQPDSEEQSLKCPRNCVLRIQLFDFEGAEKLFCEVPHTKLSFDILIWDHIFAHKKVS